MYLSNRDIKWAIECGKLIVEPPPERFGGGYDETSIDLHLDKLEAAKVWDISRYETVASARGGNRGREIHLGDFAWEPLSDDYLIPVPEDDSLPVFRRGTEVVVRQLGFLLWTTAERVGTPKVDPLGPKTKTQRHPELICFVNAKSTKARTGLMVHFTAPTIHAGWAGKVTLEITNLGPFDFVLKAGDPIAQLTVATISSAPDMSLRKSKQQTQDQLDPSGTPKRTGRRRAGN